MTSDFQHFTIGYTVKPELITVCDKCLTAACWQGIFMCIEARDAGVVQRSRAELKKLKLEHPSYWKTGSKIRTAIV